MKLASTDVLYSPEVDVAGAAAGGVGNPTALALVEVDAEAAARAARSALVMIVVGGPLLILSRGMAGPEGGGACATSQVASEGVGGSIPGSHQRAGRIRKTKTKKNFNENKKDKRGVPSSTSWPRLSKVHGLSLEEPDRAGKGERSLIRGRQEGKKARE